MNILDLIGKKTAMPVPGQTLLGRAEPIATAETHFVNHHPLKGPYPVGSEQAVFGLGCFWGAEKVFWKLDGVYVTAVGYAGGETPNPTYRRSLHGQNRSQRGRAGRLRSQEDQLRDAGQGLLRGT